MWQKIGMIVLMIGLVFSLAAPVLAQQASGANIQVIFNKARLTFPESVTFTLQAESQSEISEVYLRYGTNGRSCTQGAARQKVELTTGTSIDVEWTWDFRKSRNLPSGAQVWWQWEITDKSGDTLQTEQQVLIIEDPNFTWKSVTAHNVSVFWAKGSQQFGENMLALAVQSLKNLEEQAGIRPQGAVRLTLYPTFEDVRNAVLFTPDWMGGVAYSDFSVILIGLPDDDEDWAREVIPHELAHLVTGERVFNCLGVTLPTWLEEGLAVYSEGPTSSPDYDSLQDALEDGTLPSLRTLAAGFAASSTKANQAYAYSGQVLHFMIAEYGPEKMADLLATMQSGKTIDAALSEVYGFDTDGLDAAFRTFRGVETTAPALSDVTATPAPTAVPTMALWTASFGFTPTTTPTLSATPAPTETVAATDVPPPSSTYTAPPETPVAAETLAASTQKTPTASSGGAGSPLRCLGGAGLTGGVFTLMRFLRRTR